MHRVRQLWKNESGAVLIFVAVVIFALAAMAILAVDISKLFVARVQLQNAADAGALAGAEMFVDPIPPPRDSIEQHARTVAQMNRAFGDHRQDQDPVSNVSDVTAVAVTDVNATDYGTVTVTARSLVSQYFTPVTALMQGGAVTPTVGNVAAVAAARAGPVCKVRCLKPWSIPDRWDDTGKPGWPQWANNKRWDSEKFTDLNEDGLWNPGELFEDGVDANSKSKAGGAKDGQYTSEFYNFFLTGYIASRDLGELMRFKVADPHEASAPGQFYPIDLCLEDGKCTGADVYRWNIANCNPTFYGPGDWIKTENGNMKGPTKQGVSDLIAKDPGAYWDESCQCVSGSAFPVGASPRIGFLPLHDPRIPLDSGKMSIFIAKIIAVFFEEQFSNGDIYVRFIKVQSPGEQCPPGTQGAGYVFNLSLIR